MVGRVILGDQVNGLGLDAQVHVLRDERYFLGRMVFGKAVGAVEDAVIGHAVIEDRFKIGMEFLVETDKQFALVLADRDAAVEDAIPADLVDLLEEMPGMEVQALIALFKFVEFLNNGNGDDNIMFFELVKTRAVVENDIGVKDEYFFFALYHREGLRMALSSPLYSALWPFAGNPFRCTEKMIPDKPE